MEDRRTYTAFAGQRMIASGELEPTLLGTRRHLDGGAVEPVLVFDDETGQQVDFDLRGTPDEMLERLAAHPHVASTSPPAPARTGPGRPRLGVVSREVSLLPRHWAWLEQQSGGCSAVLRRLVDEARRQGQSGERARRARDAANRFMWAMCGDLPGFEEATRALFAGDHARLGACIRGWPDDLRRHTERLAGEAARLSAESAGTAPTS